MHTLSVAVLGGGIQGACSALALARLGASVTLFEADERLLNRASFRSEGKIHLGFVYANDPTGKTADLMLEAALHFAPLLDDWVGPVAWDRLRSRPFTYASLPGSQLSDDVLRAHYERIDETYRSTYRDSGLHYLGHVPPTLLPTLESTGVAQDGSWPAVGATVAHTAEVAVERARFRGLLSAALHAAPGVQVRLGHRVDEVVRTSSGFRVSTSRADGTRGHHEVGTVVNCTWSDRLRLDRQCGVEPERPWVYRLKYRVLGQLPGSGGRPSITFALGPFGDAVTYPDDTLYLSWYPVCMRGWSQEITPPDAWDPACAGRTPEPDAADVADALVREFGAILPDLHRARIDDVGAGAIFSWGTEDIDRPTSELHRRSEIGVEGGEGYYTINTGKFTCAPLFAKRLAARVRAEGGLG